jgi:glutamate synthase domain-containing protein 1
MCGVSGDVRFDGEPADPCAVARMTDRMTGRGPDGSGLWNDGWVALGHRRLAVIDPTEAGAQPMADDRLGLAVVFNGCIYNHAALRRELEAAGHGFASTSDTEVLLKGWARGGRRCSTASRACSPSRWWNGLRRRARLAWGPGPRRGTPGRRPRRATARSDPSARRAGSTDPSGR